MNQREHLKKNPIIETAVGISLKNLFKELSELEQLSAAMRPDFSIVRPSTTTSVTFDTKKRKGTEFKQETDGLQLTSTDGKQLLLVLQNLLQLRSKRPYVNFETTLEEFTSYLSKITQKAKDLIIGEDVMLEYVNLFHFPYSDVERYYKILPHIYLSPAHFSLNRFRGEFHTETNTGVKARILSDMIPLNGQLDVHFVISVQKKKNGLTLEELPDILQQLNQTADQIFFDNITTEYIQYAQK